jgi:CheY-like chemotaxis protein
MRRESGSEVERILVAVGDSGGLRLVKTILEKQGFVVTGVMNGGEAYRLLSSKESFAAAVFDFIMPYMTGFDLVKYMQTEPFLAEIPVVLLTPDQNLSLAFDIIPIESVQLLHKPFTILQLQEMVRKLTNKNKYMVEEKIGGKRHDTENFRKPQISDDAF